MIKKDWPLAQIEKEEYNFCFKIKFDEELVFQDISPQNVVEKYMNYYEKNTGKRYLFDGYEVFGMLSPIVWKIWGKLLGQDFNKFGNIIRFKPKAILPDNYWISSENPTGIIDSGGRKVPFGRNIEDIFK